VTFIVSEALPVLHIGGKVDFFGGPEGGLGLLVHLPNLHWIERRYCYDVSDASCIE
jgi:hypothetical protein